MFDNTTPFQQSEKHILQNGKKLWLIQCNYVVLVVPCVELTTLSVVMYANINFHIFLFCNFEFERSSVLFVHGAQIEMPFMCKWNEFAYAWSHLKHKHISVFETKNIIAKTISMSTKQQQQQKHEHQQNSKSSSVSFV